MKTVLLCALLVGIVSANDSSCGTKPNAVEDCDHPDLGSCGNACCAIDCNVQASPEDVRDAIESFLESGGLDGSFTRSDKADSAGHDPSDDLRQYNISAKFIFQGTHATTGGYVDTLNFALYDGEQGDYTTRVRAFSISNIHGALGDNGQNYKTLAYLSKAMESQNGAGCDRIDVVHGCGKK
eukprot:g1154.t1